MTKISSLAPLSVKDPAFGATGNGATDDSAAIGAAITAAGTGGSLYFPTGTYIASNLTPLSGQTWWGPGTLKLAAGVAAQTALVTATSISGFTLGRGLVLDGNASNQTNNNNNGLVYLVSPTNCRIVGVTVKNTIQAGIAASTPAICLRMPNFCSIINSFISSVGYGILLGANTADTTAMYGNVIDNVMLDSCYWDSIFLTENLSTTTLVTVHNYLRGTVVSNCTITNFGDAAIEVGSGTLGTTVVGCVMDNTAGPTLNTSNPSSGVLMRDTTDLAITGCTFRNIRSTVSSAPAINNLNLNATSSNVSVTGCVVDTVDDGFYDQDGISNATVTGNIFNACAQDISGTSGVHTMASSARFTISGNVFSNTLGTAGSNRALYINGSHDITVVGNTFYNNTSADAIIVNSGAHNVVISGNRVGPSNTRGIRIFDTASHDITIVNNDVSGNTTNLSNSSTAGGNRIEGNDGYNPVGPASVTPGASPWTFTNGPTSSTLYITGGTVSSVVKNSVNLGAVSGAFSLGPNDTLTVTYSAAPTVVQDVK